MDSNYQSSGIRETAVEASSIGSDLALMLGDRIGSQKTSFPALSEEAIHQDAVPGTSEE